MEIEQVKNEKLLEMLSAGAELPRLTGAGAELLSIMHVPVAQIEMQRVMTLVESDPTLTAAILRTANSAYFGALREITTVPQAITRIGLEDTMHILSYHCLRGMMPAPKSLPHFSSKDFWVHSWATATAARMLAKPQYLLHTLPGQLYTAGLLHDIGKVILATHLGESFDKACVTAREQSIPIHQAEMEVIGLDHTQLGGRLLDDWNLPHPILGAVGAHHSPEQAKPEVQEITMLIDLADAIAHQCGFGDGTGQPVRDPMLTAIARDPNSPLAAAGALQPLIAEISTKLSERAQIFHKSGNSAPRGKPSPRVQRSAEYPTPSRGSAPEPPRGLWQRAVGWMRNIFM